MDCSQPGPCLRAQCFILRQLLAHILAPDFKIFRILLQVISIINPGDCPTKMAIPKRTNNSIFHSPQSYPAIAHCLVCSYCNIGVVVRYATCLVLLHTAPCATEFSTISHRTATAIEIRHRAAKSIRGPLVRLYYQVYVIIRWATWCVYPVGVTVIYAWWRNNNDVT